MLSKHILDLYNRVTMGVLEISPDAAITPTVISVSQNNYAPTGIGSAVLMRLSSNSNIELTGLVAPSPAAARVLFMVNVGSEDIKLKNESVSSSAANRFAISGDITVQSNESMTLIYDPVSARWRVMGVYV